MCAAGGATSVPNDQKATPAISTIDPPILHTSNGQGRCSPGMQQAGGWQLMDGTGKDGIRWDGGRFPLEWVPARAIQTFEPA